MLTVQLHEYKAASFDRQCKLTYDIAVLGKAPLQMARGLRVGMKQSLIERGSDVFWAGEVRSLIRNQPEAIG